MTFTPVPKPQKHSDEDKTVERLVKAWSRKKRWADRAIQRAKGKPRTRVKERYEKRIARKAKHYAAVIRSAFNKLLRYTAFLRSGGLCECEQCTNIRAGVIDSVFPHHQQEIDLAFTPIPCWFVNRGGAAHLRFRSTDGELHHTNYKYFGTENPDEIRFVQFTWNQCHQRIEAEHGTRRRFLKGGR